MRLLYFLFVVYILVVDGIAANSISQYIEKYHPKQILGSSNIHVYPSNKIELIEQKGTTDEMIRVAETAIQDNYTLKISRQGYQTDRIGDIMHKFYGGFWTVMFIEDPYIFFSTVLKRSPSYMLFDVNDAGVMISRAP